MLKGDFEFLFTDVPESIIKVIGVGGGGGNAVEYMFEQGIKDVDFIVCNTDKQMLDKSKVPNKIQIGDSGLGAGAKPKVGRELAEASKEKIMSAINKNTKMVFITAGMGGGTGTGAAPVIAGLTKEAGILTVGIVTAPFEFEGPRRWQQALDGIEEMKKNCDTLLIILNDNVRKMYSSLKVTAAFKMADNILCTAAKSIAEIITHPGVINVDFEDVRTVMKGSGTAVMGSAVASGEGRAKKAATEALHSPLLNSNEIKGAKKILVSIRSGEDELGMDEFGVINEYFQEAAGSEANIIVGYSCDVELKEAIQVTVIATCFNGDDDESAPSGNQPPSAKVEIPVPTEKAAPKKPNSIGELFNVPNLNGNGTKKGNSGTSFKAEASGNSGMTATGNVRRIPTSITDGLPGTKTESNSLPKEVEKPKAVEETKFAPTVPNRPVRTVPMDNVKNPSRPTEPKPETHAKTSTNPGFAAKNILKPEITETAADPELKPKVVVEVKSTQPEPKQPITASSATKPEIENAPNLSDRKSQDPSFNFEPKIVTDSVNLPKPETIENKIGQPVPQPGNIGKKTPTEIPNPDSRLTSTRMRLQMEAEERRKSGGQSSKINYHDGITARSMDEPAFLRHKVAINTEIKTGRLSVNDDNEIQNNNRFLHDRPD